MNEIPESPKIDPGPATPDMAASGLPLVRLGDLGPDTIIDEANLAALFGKCRMSIKRAVQRGELPTPARMLGQPTWTVKAILDHIEKRLERAAKDAERLKRKSMVL